MPVKVAIQGQRGSFHDIAARQFLGKDIRLVSCETFADTFACLARGHADKIVVALENSLFGSINQTYDMLLKYKFWISNELYLHVKQCLIGLAGAEIQKILEVHSQLPALAQCEVYLDTYLPKARRVEQHDTAASVAAVKAWDDPTKAAIASAEAAKFYGLSVLAAEIETHKQNYTRFVVIETKPRIIKKASKTSLVLTTSHKPGALYTALGVFARRNMNLTKLQSRPIIGKAWEYMFYIDVTESGQSDDFQAALTELNQQGCTITVMGSYPAGKITS
jgi:prephenate dehydratase